MQAETPTTEPHRAGPEMSLHFLILHFSIDYFDNEYMYSCNTEKEKYNIFLDISKLYILLELHSC